MNFARWVVGNLPAFLDVRKNADAEGITEHITVFGEWCFYHDTPVLLADGTSKKIGEIVRDKLPLEVMTYNETTGKIEPKKIIGWSKQDDANDWLTITVKRRHRGGKSTRLIVTKNHKIYVAMKDGEPFEIEAKKIKPGDNVFVFGKQMSYYQQQFIAGSLLGDGSFDSYGIFNCSHSNKQSFYSEWIENLLSSIVTRTENTISGFGSDMKKVATQALPEIKNLQDMLMNEGSKEPTKEYMNHLHAPAFAAWFMDDGNICSGQNNRQHQAELSTLGFNKDAVDDLVEWFNDHNYNCYRLNNGNDQYLIRFTPNGSEAFFRMIAPYVLKEFSYKLPEYLHTVPKVD
jgi:recombination protein RecA